MSTISVTSGIAVILFPPERVPAFRRAALRTGITLLAWAGGRDLDPDHDEQVRLREADAAAQRARHVFRYSYLQ